MKSKLANAWASLKPQSGAIPLLVSCLSALALQAQAAPILRITEVMSSGDIGDWFEVTNYGDTAADITGYHVDDSSYAVATAFPLNGVTSIAPGESVIFIEGTATTATTMKTNWGLSVAAQVGYYSGSAIGLSSTADGVTLFTNSSANSGTELTGPFGGLIRVSFGAATTGTSFNWSYDATGASTSSPTGQLTTGTATWTNVAVPMIGTPAVPTPAAPASAVSLATAAIAEGNSGTVTLNVPVSRNVTYTAFTVDYAVTGGTATADTDYATLAAGTLTFTANGAASQNIAITVNGDATIESNETITLTLSNLVNTTGTTVIGTASASGTITNDDAVPLAFPPTNALTTTVKSSIALGGSEIPAFDPASKRAFATSNVGIQVVDLTTPATPTQLATITPATLGVSGLTSNDVSSIAVRKGTGGNPSVLAASIISSPKTAAGYVVFLNAANGTLLGSVAVGANPDHVSWTPDGTKLLVANEGEVDGTAADVAADATLGTVSIINVASGFTTPVMTTANFTAYDSQVTTLRAAGVRIFKNASGTDAVPSMDFEPEYIAVSADSTSAMVTLQEANAVAVLDIATATFTSVKALGKKDFSTLRADFSDRDGAGATNLVNPTTGSPVFGLYMPDAIGSYTAGGRTFYVTANEGDDRNDFLTPDETTTVANAGYDLDNTIFPNELALKNNAALGRLGVVNSLGNRGDTDGDGDIDEIQMLGARSFSILDAAGNIVFDSGDMIEMIVASQHIANFDDGRSDNKGGEPEGVAIATLGGRTYAFIGLERHHMGLVFDVTNPAAVTYTTSFKRSGDLNPEGMVVVSAADSPTGKPLLLLSSEVSNTLTVFEIDGAPAADYTLQLLHYYGESGLLGIQTAPIMGAMIDKFDNDYANTLVLAEGDSFIPGPWLIAGADPSLNSVAGIGATALGRPDIAIMNAFGTSASALGNHEFDLGSPVFSGAIVGSGAWVGAQFPFITANLDFTADSSLKPRADTSLGGTGGSIAGLETSALKARIAPYAIKTINGQKVGIVGATTWDLLSKTSANGTTVKDDANAATSDLQEVAAYVQAAVNALIAQGVNKVIMVDQLDVLQRNKDLAPLLSGVDVMIAGGGHERMGDATDTAVAFNGHDANFIADAYPIVTAGADSKPVLIVTTDTEYSYLGRLVVDFDANGELIVGNLNTSINGAYASTEATLQSVYGSVASAATLIAASPMASSVKVITDAINAVVTAKDGTVYGYTNVYLEGDRVFGRTQEVNLGNITADANASAARTALGLPATAAVFSLKNGGGIRASLGSVLGDGTKVGPLANPITGKPVNGISQLDVENALRFDNKLMTCEMTPAGLLNILNFAAGLSSGASAQSGGYPQVGNIRFSYDYSNTAARVRNAVLVNDNGDITARLIENGVVRADAPALVRAVILNFTANGGDGYPIKANADNFRYVLNNGTLSGIIAETLDFTSAANVPVNAAGEQSIFAAYLTAKHGSVGTAYNTADTAVALDTRIQQLAGGIRTDTVNDGTVFMVTPAFTTSPASQSIALGSSVTLSVAVTGSPDPTLQWYLGTAGDTTNPIANATSTSFTTPVLVADTSYWVRATNQAGTADSSTATISVSYSTAFSSTSRSVLRPNTASWSPSGVTVNGTTFVNLGLQGVGRVPASSIDAATGETLGSISDMQITGWKKNANGSYSGTLQTLPDRGYNSGTVYSNYAARINAFNFTFTPYTSASPTTEQNQIALTFAGSSRFTYNDGTGQKYSTGLLANAVTTLSSVPYPAASVSTTQSDGTVANRLTIDSEGLVLDNRAGKSGAGWVSDEYGPYIYHFNAAKQIDGQLQLPQALIPHSPVGTTSFVDTNVNGRRANQGMEGLAQSPDGTKLFALLQSATIQDSLSGNQGRFNTRLLVYDISGNDLPSDPVAQYVIQLPVANDAGNGGAPNRNLAQSAILALNDHQILILSRDGNGRGVPTSASPVFKSILLADLNGATNIDGTYDAEGNTILASGALNAAITPLVWSEALNLIGKLGTSTIAEVAKFGLNISAGNGDINSICEKWEALALVSANDVANPNDYFLFVGNDNDFASATGKYMAADGTLVDYNAGLENDTIVLAYRVRMTGADNQRPFLANTIADQPPYTGAAFSLAFAANTFADPESGTLTYTATKGDDTALPAWLTFNAATRTFSGTPAVGDIGTLVVKVTATDNGSPALFTSTTFTITISEQETAPTDINLSATSLFERNLPNAIIGTLTATDANLLDTHTFSLVSGQGSTDNASFNITGNSLTIIPVTAFNTKGNYSIRIRATDSSSGALAFEKAFVISVDPLSSIQFDQADVGVNQGSTSVNLVVRRTNTTHAASVLLSTANGTATSGTDYTAISGQSISFAAGVSSATVTVALSGAAITSSKNFTATLSSASSGATIGSISTTTVRIKADTSAPVVAITAPAANSLVKEPLTSSATVKITGTITGGASDTVSIRINGGTPISAVRTGSSWAVTFTGTAAANAALVGGSNTVVATATDMDGNVGTSAARSFFYEQLRPITVMSTNGTVTFLPALTGGKAVVGRSYAVSAKPNLTFVFAGWSGSANFGNASAPSTSFIFALGNTVAANFVASPFSKTSGLPGLYNGIVKGSGTEDTAANAGCLKCNVAVTTGAFTGALVLDGQTTPLAGVFSHVDGTFTTPIINNGMVFSLDLDFTTKVINGTITKRRRGANVSVLTVAISQALPALPANTYNVAFAPPTAPLSLQPEEYPHGNGFALVSVSAKAVATVSGVLADGTAYTSSASVCAPVSASTFNTIPVYASFTSVKGALVGVAVVQPGVPVATTSITGTGFRWFKGESATQHYPYGYAFEQDTGLTLDIAAGGLRSAALPPVIKNGTSTLSLVDGGFSVTNALINGTTVTLSLNAATKQLSGSYTSSSGLNAIGGIVVGNTAYGYVLSPLPTQLDGSGQAGKVTVTP